MKTLRLKKNEDRRLRAGHLWIFSNEIDTNISSLDQYQIGECVLVENSQGKKLGIAYINPKTLLCARILSKDVNTKIDSTFFEKRFSESLKLRQEFYSKPYYRLIYGESDLLPGLVIDRFENIFVVQITTAGMENFKNEITAALLKDFYPSGILFRNDGKSRETENLPSYVEIAFGHIPDVICIQEHDVHFDINLKQSQKTGWYYDQEHNRANIKKYVQGKKVLDVYSYVGAFGLEAAFYGAKHVTSIDSSQNALENLLQNAKLNNLQNKISTINEDALIALKKLKDENEKFDVVMLDPPAFIKKKKDHAAGLSAYQRINDIAVELLNERGVLITSSCSMHLSKQDLMNVVRRSGINNNRHIQILEYGQQALDHPIHPAISETEYLKTLFCWVV